MSILVLRDVFKSTWQDKDAFQCVAEITGDEIRNKEGRRTLKFDFASGVYYLKFHTGVGWFEIAKNLSQLKWPVVGATNEWEAINLLLKLGVDTLDPVAYGKKGLNPAKQCSFIITKELTGTFSLAKYCETWPEERPAFLLKKAIIAKLAQTARTMHEAGMNHRDLYLCHFLLDISNGIKNVEPDALKFHVVDLHRAQRRKQVPLRWRVKDVASLYFSAMDIGLTKTDWLRFIQIYTGKTVRQTFKDDAIFWRLVRKRAEQLYFRDFKRPAPPFQL